MANGLEESKSKGEVIAEMIKKAGYFQKEVADKIGLGENYLSRALRNDTLSAKSIQKIAGVLGISVQELCNFSTIPPYRWSDAVRVVNEPQAAYGNEVEALREEIRRLKQQNAEMAKELEKRGEMNSDLLEILKSLAKGEK